MAATVPFGETRVDPELADHWTSGTAEAATAVKTAHDAADHAANLNTVRSLQQLPEGAMMDSDIIH